MHSRTKGVASAPIATGEALDARRNPDRGALAREVNGHILGLEARLDDERFLARDPDQYLIGMFCECGCGGMVAVTRADYETNGGVWIEGHKPAGRQAPGRTAGA